MKHLEKIAGMHEIIEFARQNAIPVAAAAGMLAGGLNYAGIADRFEKDWEEDPEQVMSRRNPAKAIWKSTLPIAGAVAGGTLGNGIGLSIGKEYGNAGKVIGGMAGGYLANSVNRGYMDDYLQNIENPRTFKQNYAPNLLKNLLKGGAVGGAGMAALPFVKNIAMPFIKSRFGTVGQ